MNQDTTTEPTLEATGTPAEAPPSGSTESAASPSMQAMAADLKALGQQFAAVLRAATSTPEAEQLTHQIRDGLRSLRDEIDEALETARTGSRRVASDQASSVAARAQAELANALQALSRGLDSLATSVAPRKESGAESTESGDGPAA